MKHKRLLVLVLIFSFVSISALFIYKATYKEEFNYVALGDSLASGRNPYGVDDYGYTDYIKDYLISNEKYNSYLNYAVAGYETTDLIKDINLNITTSQNNNNVGIKRALREADLVTVSIGANDFLSQINITNVNNQQLINEKIDEIMLRVKDTLVLIKKYAKKDIVVVGYYNPIPNLTTYQDIINQTVQYSDNRYETLCNELEITYVKISDLFINNNSFLPNPNDIHPNKQGYDAISKRIISVLETK